MSSSLHEKVEASYSLEQSAGRTGKFIHFAPYGITKFAAFTEQKKIGLWRILHYIHYQFLKFSVHRHYNTETSIEFKDMI